MSPYPDTALLWHHRRISHGAGHCVLLYQWSQGKISYHLTRTRLPCRERLGQYQGLYLSLYVTEPMVV